MDRAETRILAIVAAKSGVNPDRRRGQVSLATFVSQGLAGPKMCLNWNMSKGKQVNSPAPSSLCASSTPDAFG